MRSAPHRAVGAPGRGRRRPPVAFPAERGGPSGRRCARSAAPGGSGSRGGRCIAFVHRCNLMWQRLHERRVHRRPADVVLDVPGEVSVYAIDASIRRSAVPRDGILAGVVVRLHPHARQRSIERGASVDEVVATVLHGERIPAKHGRIGFRRNFAFGRVWQGRVFATKQVEAYAIEEAGDWIVITVITKFY